MGTHVLVETDGEAFQITSWPPTAELFDAEYEFRTFIQTVHPDAESALFGQSAGIWEFTASSGNLHMLYLDEYLAFRSG